MLLLTKSTSWCRCGACDTRASVRHTTHQSGEEETRAHPPSTRSPPCCSGAGWPTREPGTCSNSHKYTCGHVHEPRTTRFCCCCACCEAFFVVSVPQRLPSLRQLSSSLKRVREKSNGPALAEFAVRSASSSSSSSSSSRRHVRHAVAHVDVHLAEQLRHLQCLVPLPLSSCAVRRRRKVMMMMAGVHNTTTRHALCTYA